MQVRIIKIRTNESVEAYIEKSGKLRLPSFHEGWRFNFNKHAKTKDVQTYVLITRETPEIIEGCLIYKMVDNNEPYMAYIETAPHNKGKGRHYDLVAGCLIAFACRLSFQLGKGDFQGWLAFDVQEPTVQDQIKLMALYSTKYYAKRIPGTTSMCILPEDGEKLIDKYLES